ncbi:MAG: DUF192 domain-containing protein [Brevinematales bacterium]|nr:DUF192 domain-containing protein [Brevinematales bacterium]
MMIMAAKKILLTIILLGKTLVFEAAITPEQKSKGLMYRKDWGQIDGMIFVNTEPIQVSFWMKNTYLDMVTLYMDKDYNILEVYHPTPLSEELIVSKSTNIMYVLEIKSVLSNLIVGNPSKFKTAMENAKPIDSE